MSLGLALALVLAAEPAVLLAPSVRVHLRASEEVAPDHLRAFARKNVTLWLTTRSNALRASTLDTLNRFGDAWIHLRAPVTEPDAAQLSKVPRAGVVLDARDLDRAQRILGPRRLAIRLEGPLDAALVARLAKTRPDETLWRAPAELDLLTWSLFRQLPGRKLLYRATAAEPIASADGGHVDPCPPDPASAEPAPQGPVAAAPFPFPCGRGPRVEVPLDVDRAVLQRLLVRDPSTELVVDLPDDPRQLSKARRLFDDLGLK